MCFILFLAITGTAGCTFLRTQIGDGPAITAAIIWFVAGLIWRYKDHDPRSAL